MIKAQLQSSTLNVVNDQGQQKHILEKTFSDPSIFFGYNIIPNILYAFIFLIFMVQIIYLIRKRNNPAIKYRSPQLLIIGGIAQMTDSLINIGIAQSNSNVVQCRLGIFTTVIFYYIGWSCIALRAYRMLRVIEIKNQFLKDYFKESQDTAHFSSRSLDIDPIDCDTDSSIRLNELEEKKLVIKVLLLFILPNIILAIMSIFSPYAYMLVPVYQSDQCMQSYDFYIPCSTIQIIENVNESMFVVINFLLIVCLIILYKLLETVKQELSIKKELRYIIVVWGCIDVIYFTLKQATEIESIDPNAEKHIEIAIFCFILLRNFLAFSISTQFCHNKIKNPEAYIYEKPELITSLDDFEGEILNSKIFVRHFKQYVKLNHNKFQVCFTFIELYQLYQNVLLCIKKKVYLNAKEETMLQDAKDQLLLDIKVLYSENKALLKKRYLQRQQEEEEKKLESFQDLSNNRSYSQMQKFVIRIDKKSSINSSLQFELNIDKIYSKSLIKLKFLYQEYKTSPEFNALVKDKLDMLTEDRFLKHAGFKN